MGHPGRVRLAYIDESYSGGHFVLGVVLVDASAASAVRVGLDEVVRDAHTRHSVPMGAEIHAHDVMQGTGSWVALKGKARASVGVLDAAVDVVVGSGAALVVSRVERVAGGPRIASAEAVSAAYTLALEGAVAQLHCACVEQGDHIALIADEVVNRDLHRRSLVEFQERGLPEREGTGITRIVDTLYFGPSGASRLLQSADVVAYIFHRVMASGTVNEAAAREAKAMAERLRTRVVGEALNGR